MKKQTVCRWVIYTVGMLVLALGITLNTKAGLGASAIVSVPYTVSQGTGLDFANLTLVTYCLLVVAQYFIKGKAWRWSDLLQVVVSVVFTQFLSIFGRAIPYQSGNLPLDLVVLALGIIFTGVGAAMTVGMRLVPNPGDGIVGSIADRCGKELGVCKNFFDIGCVCVSLVIGFFFGKVLLGVGLGTVLSMLGVGRVISLFNHFAKAPLQKLAGLAEAASA